ncbi:MAG: [FeFe] hydrogenase H-cluster maturation GTPase HydF [Bacteroidales bacterium]|jgi:[FeFe] hydrogenase H-cluster maturation GTPase HydF|nr:[FeFe] hydrogenase H-cluster maturation GTPase HydF [Bacteroidales bacterium]
MNKGRESKPHIGIFGRRNSGKSSIINALTGQEVAIVSPHEGTTTDPVRKSLEIRGVGPSVLIDTAGIDDVGDLGEKRVKKSLQVVATIDAALLIITHNTFGEPEEQMVSLFQKYRIPYLIVHNKTDQEPLSIACSKKIKSKYGIEIIPFSAINPINTEALIFSLQRIIPETAYQRRSLLGDIVNPDNVVLLIAPQDTEAPEGRLILPQIQVIRDLLDNDCVAVIVKVGEAEKFLKIVSPKPALIITDSQAFSQVKNFVPENMPLTGFSIVLASQHHNFRDYIKGTPKIAELQDGDRVLILESCTHQITCEDIGRHKIPNWIREFTGKNIEFDIISGMDQLPRSIHEYAMAIQCGGCVFTKKQLAGRVQDINVDIPVSNYGMAIAFMQGIFERAIRPFCKRK